MQFIFFDLFYLVSDLTINIDNLKTNTSHLYFKKFGKHLERMLVHSLSFLLCIFTLYIEPF